MRLIIKQYKKKKNNRKILENANYPIICVKL